ncbi:MAG TPA: alpha/beta hydrolase [Vicinamibacterales bacterium]|nr:alpha/beta hydrolase [Vicinamibacterales bacterium]
MDGLLRRLSGPAAGAVLTLLVVGLHARQSGDWKDPSPHVTRFVSVGRTVRLEVLDWGGSGRPLVLLAGGGDTAHVFDDFAPKLTPGLHVYGLTRRGFGASGFDAAERGGDRLGDDLLTVLDSLELTKPVLLGHSVAGREMSSVASGHPDRVAGLVYLEAAYPYAFDNGTGPTVNEFQNLRGPQDPPPGEADLASFHALREYYLRVLGFTYPEAELRQRRPINPDGRVGKERDSPGYAMLLADMKKYAALGVPALVIFAEPHGQGSWIEKNTDPNVRAAARAYAEALTAVTERQVKVVENSAPNAHVVKLPGAHHYVFLSNDADVLRELRSFLNGLP